MGKELFKNIPSKVGDLVKDVRNGRIGLPDLQRPFVWRDNKVRELFDSMLKGYASVTIAGAFAVHGLRVIETDKGRFISMPQESYKKNGETVYNDTFHAVTAEARTALVDAVNDAYEQRLQERMEQSEDAPARGMEQQM